MRRHQGCWPRGTSTEDAADVVDRVNLHLLQANSAHTLCHIGRALRLLKRRGGNVTQMHRFVEHLVKAIDEPGEALLDCWRRYLHGCAVSLRLRRQRGTSLTAPLPCAGHVWRYG